MGEEWRKAPGGGALLTVYPDGTMGSEPDMVRRMRLGQLQAALVTTTGLAEIEPGVTGLQSMPKVFRSLKEVDFIAEKLQPMLEKRLEEKGFVVLFWTDTGFVRFFSKQPVVAPENLRKTKLFVSASRPARWTSIASSAVIPWRSKWLTFCQVFRPGSLIAFAPRQPLRWRFNWTPAPATCST